MLALYKKIRPLIHDESGQTMVEYALMLALVALVVMLAVPAVTTAITTLFGKIATALTPA